MCVEPLLDKELGDSQKLNFGQCLIAEPGFRGNKGQSKGPSKGDLNPSWIFTVSHYYFTDYSFKLHVDCMGRLLWRRYVWVRYVYTVHKFAKKISNYLFNYSNWWAVVQRTGGGDGGASVKADIHTASTHIIHSYLKWHIWPTGQHHATPAQTTILLNWLF